jgi:hypothetical protein
MILTHQKPDLLGSLGVFLSRSWKTILLIITVVLATLVVSSLVSKILENRNGLNFPSIGNIHTIGLKAYWDPNLQNETKNIRWGTIYTGGSYNLTLYLQSTGNVPVMLKMQYNWALQDSSNTTVFEPNSTTFDYMSLNWTYNNQTLNRSQTIEVTLILYVDSSADFIKTLIDTSAKQFTMDITIQANEQ